MGRGRKGRGPAASISSSSQGNRTKLLPSDLCCLNGEKTSRLRDLVWRPPPSFGHQPAAAAAPFAGRGGAARAGTKPHGIFTKTLAAQLKLQGEIGATKHGGQGALGRRFSRREMGSDYFSWVRESSFFRELVLAVEENGPILPPVGSVRRPGRPVAAKSGARGWSTSFPGGWEFAMGIIAARTVPRHFFSCSDIGSEAWAVANWLAVSSLLQGHIRGAGKPARPFGRSTGQVKLFMQWGLEADIPRW